MISVVVRNPVSAKKIIALEVIARIVRSVGDS
jgi:hypothetical protein